MSLLILYGFLFCHFLAFFLDPLRKCFRDGRTMPELLDETLELSSDLLHIQLVHTFCCFAWQQLSQVLQGPGGRRKRPNDMLKKAFAHVAGVKGVSRDMGKLCMMFLLAGTRMYHLGQSRFEAKILLRAKDSCYLNMNHPTLFD